MSARVSSVWNGLKWCDDCASWLQFSSFHGKTQLSTYCKRHHNARGKQREKDNPVYGRASQQRRRAWDRRNPERKRVFEGRAIFLGRAEAPEILQRAERLAVRLGMKNPEGAYL